MGIKQLSKVVADIAPGAIKQQEMKVRLTLHLFLMHCLDNLALHSFELLDRFVEN